MMTGGDAMAAESEVLATSAGKPVALGAVPVTVNLAPPASDKAAPLSARIATASKDRKVYLVVKGLRTNEPPEVLYQLYVGLPPGAAPKPDGIHYVGSFNFFEAMSQGGGSAKSTRFDSFDVTDLVKSLQSRKALGDTITVTIAPAGAPRGSAKPLVGEIALVAQ